MEKKSVKKIIVVSFILIFLITAGIVIATEIVPSNANIGFRTNHSTRIQVWAVGDCQHINNTDATYDYFIPTKTSTELNSFKSYRPSGVTVAPCLSSNVSNKRISYWAGWVNMHTNDSGVWVHDPDCSSGYPTYTEMDQCTKWWSETYSYRFFANEHIYSWRAGGCSGAYLENWTKATYTCLLCTDIVTENSCESAGCYWHNYGMECSVDYCYNYGSDSTKCGVAGCFYSGGYCYGGYTCNDLSSSESVCFMDIPRDETDCSWDYDNNCCWSVGSYTSCSAHGSEYDCEVLNACMWNGYICHDPCESSM